MNKSQRIYLNTGTTETDKYINVQLEQNVDTLEFMSMSISTKDVYQNTNADYGLIVGKILANGLVGVPNAKISIFIPLTDEDSNIGEIFSIYPYKTPRDKNNEGKRYNLLPRVSRIDTITKIASPRQPFGSFPTKEEVLTNDTILTVYKKYYKYTTTSNNAGDYMIFGVPTGTQTVHMSIDITDIGKYSMTPAAMVINLGYSPNLFMDNNSKIKPSNDLGDLPHIETQEISVNVVPFWGDSQNFIIGITRQDFRIRSVLTNTFTIFGSAFTDSGTDMWGFNTNTLKEIYEINKDLNVKSKRIGKVTERIYYYPSNISDADIDAGYIDSDQMLLLDPTEYSAYKRDGDFAFIISCNRNKIITDDFENEVPVPEDSINGIFTKFRGFMTLEITPDDLPMNFHNDQFYPLRYKLKFPQHADKGHTFAKPSADITTPAPAPIPGFPASVVDYKLRDIDNKNWRQQHYTFTGGQLYSVSRFHSTVFNNQDDVNVNQNTILNVGFTGGDKINSPYKLDQVHDVGIIQVSDSVGVTGNTANNVKMVGNTVGADGKTKFFGANWLNLSVHLPQVAYDINKQAEQGGGKVISNSDFTKDLYFNYYVHDNIQDIAAGDTNTKFFARSDINWTDFINVPVSDIREMALVPSKGFTDKDLNLPNVGLDGITKKYYRNGNNIPINWTNPCPVNGGKTNGDITLSGDPKTYFYRGFGDADCIQFLSELGIV